MLSLDEIKQNLSNQKSILQNKYKIKSLGIFGSYVRGEQNSESDLDLLIDYDEPPSLFTLIEIENQLSKLLGIKVDLVTQKGIKPQLKNFILEEVVYL
ncbi:MAG: nucleotidyltransferase family protein [SAR324 cluster bacterium]|nr:nucleotidyltransferase family protein [SAR324 cluster bacterium]